VGIGIPMGMGMGGYGDDRPSPQTHGDSMGIFNQPEILVCYVFCSCAMGQYVF